MKHYIFSLFLIFGVFSVSSSQEVSYGLKGGISYTMGGQITGTQARFYDGTVEAAGEVGFHGGAFGQVNFGNFFVRPEVVYSSLESTFEFPNQPSTYSIETVTVPLLVGYNIWGPLDIYAGPVYSNVLSATLEGEEVRNPIVLQNSPINAQVGAKVEYGRFGIDIRYERSLSTAEPLALDIVNAEYGINEAIFDDARVHQVIVSLIFKIGGPGLNEGRRRPCY